MHHCTRPYGAFASLALGAEIVLPAACMQSARRFARRTKLLFKRHILRKKRAADHEAQLIVSRKHMLEKLTYPTRDLNRRLRQGDTISSCAARPMCA